VFVKYQPLFVYTNSYIHPQHYLSEQSPAVSAFRAVIKLGADNNHEQGSKSAYGVQMFLP